MVKSEPKKKPQSGGFFQKFFRKPEKSQKEQRLTVQRSIPYLEMGRDGICRVEEHLYLPWIEDFKSYQNLTSLNRRVLVELVESITVYDKEHIHIQYRFDQEIRNVLEYCNSIPTTETEGSTV